MKRWKFRRAKPSQSGSRVATLRVSLTIEKQLTNGAIRLNEAVLAEVIRAVDRISALCGATRPDAAQLLMIKGVLEAADQDS